MLNPFRTTVRRLTSISLEERRRRIINNQCTLDFVSQPSIPWKEYWPKRKMLVNSVFYTGVVFLIASIYGTSKWGIMTGVTYKLKYDLIGNEPFPGWRYDDITDEDVDRLEDNA